MRLKCIKMRAGSHQEQKKTLANTDCKIYCTYINSLISPHPQWAQFMIETVYSTILCPAQGATLSLSPSSGL